MKGLLEKLDERTDGTTWSRRSEDSRKQFRVFSLHFLAPRTIQKSDVVAYNNPENLRSNYIRISRQVLVAEASELA